ncbi:hypothetical protein Val02_32710 [Virgisporangium aliadipatigenens]|uniref:DUF6351 domain-containing protein n=1 Tax=Virgisporangium aliadipatigenens TaxID=741659 RepID=A0A8J3YLZ7_9ACTN|nr:DUF6351 family protein [Virgisporangium aliadipatigenens]GIJ46385.1 hypothetical protein Val02_32710 [Virgisporangium aliadipatigenens]
MRRTPTAVVAATLVGLLGVPGAAHATGSGRSPDITLLSSPLPHVVTGGQALLRVTPPRGVPSKSLKVTVERRDVTAAFVAQPDGSRIGLVGGLRLGASTVRVAAPRGGTDALTLVNHPADGPVFSGPQQQPFACETTAFGLDPATGPGCEAPTRVSYVYRNTAGAFVPLTDPAARPADLSSATVEGRAVPYVVRVERGVIDRAVYEIAALHDGTDPSPTRAHGAWNRRLVYTFGGGCNVGYHQGAGTGGVLNPLFLGRGYAVASSSLNVLDNNCSTVISAEVAMMVKEHFVETYGPAAHTIGWGGSGGAIQQYGIADNYPGILDGIIPQISYPDATTNSPTVGDCRLLNRWFAAHPGAFTPAQMNAVSGFRSFGTCVNWDLAFASRGNATEACPPALPVEWRYHPVTNPGGIPCTAAEQMVNQLGRDPRTGFARSYVDSTGVQYGLAALNAGTITPAQFVQLNESVGGYDPAGNQVAARNVADPFALVRVYRSGLAVAGTGGLATTPVIDYRAYTDAVNDIHTRSWSFTMRQRLIDAHGDAGTQVLLTSALTTGSADPNAYVLSAMDRWLTALGPGHRTRGRVVRARPAELGDGCWTPEGAFVAEPAVYQGPGTCNTLYPAFGDTRIAAGAPIRDNALKCHLKPFDPGDYRVTFTPAEQTRLRTTFPHGVCDWTRPGVGQVRPAGVWQHY